MTIKFFLNREFNRYTIPAGVAVTFDPSTESGFVAAGLAEWTTSPSLWRPAKEPMPAVVKTIGASIQASVSRGGNDLALRLGLQGPVYVNRSDTDKFLVNGVATDFTRPTMSFQDLFWEPGNLRSTLTGKSNIETANVGQPLVAIPGASSAPYWTDPGAVTLSRSSDTVTSQIAPHITWSESSQTWTFRSLPGYGAAAAGKRRAQVFFDKVRSRRRVCWDLSFRLPDEDDLPYSANPAYKYPMLVWQMKGSNDPFAAMSVESNGDGTANLYWYQKWSSDSADVTNYRRQFNAGNTGNTTAQAQSTRFFNYTFQRGQWLDILIESYLDERDITTAAGGFGYTNVWINGVQVLCYSGPTLSYRDTGGATPEAHSWMVGVYRHESSVPAALKELDLDRQTNPAPYTRATEWRRAKLMDLGGI